MTMKVKLGVSEEEVALFCKRASRVTLSQVVENVTVQEDLRTQGDARRTQFTVDINFYPKEEYQEEYDLETTEILSSFAVQFPLNLKKEIVSEMKKLDVDLKSQISQIGQGKAVRAKAGEAEDEEGGEPKKRKDDDEGSEVGDGDADEEKHARQKKQQATYDSDDEDDTEEIGAYDDATLEAALASDDEVVKDKVKKPKKKSFQSMVEHISLTFQKYMQQCTSFDFKEERCTFTLEVSFQSLCHCTSCC